MSTRRTPAQKAAAVRAAMESHLTALEYRNWKRQITREISIFNKQKKIRDVEGARTKVEEKKA